MNFTYETQGAITYLVCELEATEQIDSLTLGMLTNNHIQGLAPVLYTEMNGQRFLKYNISAKLTVDQFFSGNMNKQRTLTAFSNILNALCSADEYMIDQNCFSVASEHVFINVSNCETALICIPVTVEKDFNNEVASLFKKILFSTQFDQSEDASYITQLITCLNGGPSFNIYALKDLVARLQSTNAVPATPAQPSYQAPVQRPAQTAAPASPFDSTISIDDMPAAMGGNQQPVQQTMQPSVQKPPVQQQPSVQVQQPVIPTVRPVTPTAPQSPVQPAKPVVPATPVQQPGMRQTVKHQTPPMNIPKPPVSNGPGFAIPGQSVPVATPPAPAKPEKKKKEKAPADTGEKKMSLFGLLANYSKENAAIYKAQREAEKQAKAASAPAKPATPAQGKQQPVVPQVPGQAPAVRPPMQTQPAYTQPQYQAPVQPVPVQNSFNETTVLSPAMMGGETTVLSANPGVPDPCLTRIKSGERISINKPVFRIGKEKSYVDYFIGDNTAISRSHCNIHTENGEYFIEDTNSTNHTYVNGKIITSNVKTKLTNGDKIRLANEDFTFSI